LHVTKDLGNLYKADVCECAEIIEGIEGLPGTKEGACM
jgi:hypothetical protein